MSDTGFLYPFLDARERETDPLLVDLAASARVKAEESARLQESSLLRMADEIEACAQAMAERFSAGARLYAFGNGGSSTDAATLASLFARPASGRALPAWSLVADQAVLTALGNDIGFEVIFSRQLIAHARPGDIAVGLSTSGNSEDLVMALHEAHERGLLTIGFAGYDGGHMACSDDVDHCFTVDSQSIHRIQESQARVGHRLWELTQTRLAELSAAMRGGTR